jgi:indoleacetamide hydrolase
VGSHARTVADLLLFDSVLTGDFRPPEAVPPTGARLGLARAHYFADLDPEVERVTNEALKKLADAGVTLVEADVPDLTRLAEAANFPIIYHDSVPSIVSYLQEFETGVTLAQLLALASESVRENLEARALPGGRLWISDHDYAAARDIHRPALQEAFRAYFSQTAVAAIAYPTTLVPATPIGQDQEVEIRGRKVPFRTAMSRNIAPGSCAGLPGLVLCAGRTRDGLPVGIELDGAVGSDRELLALGLALEPVISRVAPA